MRAKRTITKLLAFVLTVSLLLGQSGFTIAFAAEEAVQDTGSFIEASKPVLPETPTVTAWVYENKNLSEGLVLLAGSQAISYLDENGSSQTATAAKIEAGMTALSGGWYYTEGDLTIGSTITVSGDAKIILTEGCQLTVSSSSSAGINVMEGSRLDIYAQSAGGSMGRLIATGGAGTGWDSIGSIGMSGSVVINGGNVTATGGVGTGGASIGGIGMSGPVVINGGNVTATGGAGTGGASIGGIGMSGSVIINGGNVTANSINITNGSLEVNGGGMTVSGHLECLNRSVHVNGGKVTIEGLWNSTNGAAFINGGDTTARSGIDASGGKLTVTGGTLTATAGDSGGNYARAGIVTDQSSVVLISGGKVEARGGKGYACGAGIGSNSAERPPSLNNAGNITITGGTVIAVGGSNGNLNGAGIGGGGVGDFGGGNGGTVKITGGTVTATGGAETSGGAGICAGIGGGSGNVTQGNIQPGTGGTAIITGGSVKGTIQASPLTSDNVPVYLGKLQDQPGIEGVSVDGLSYFISKNHEGDGSLYLYMPGKNHTVDVQKTDGTIIRYTAAWNSESSGFTFDSGNPQMPPAETSITLTLSAYEAEYGTEAPVVITAEIVDSSLSVKKMPMMRSSAINTVEFYLNEGTMPFATGAVMNGRVTAEMEVNSLNLGKHTLKANYGGSYGGGSSEAAALLTITQAHGTSDPDYKLPQNLACTYSAEGTLDTLIPLNEHTGWTWKNGNEIPVAGKNSYTAVYTPVNPNYKAVDVELAVTVNKAGNTLVISCDDITYGQALEPKVIVNTGGGTVSYEYKVRGWDDSTYGTEVPTDAGSYTVRGTSAATANYKEEAAAVDFAVRKATPAIALNADTIQAQGTAVLKAVLTRSGAGTFPTGTVKFRNGQVLMETAALSDGTAIFTWNNIPAGTHTLSAEYSGDNNYNGAAAVLANYNVGKKNQANLSFCGIPDILVFGGKSFTLSMDGGSGEGAVIYRVSSGDAVSINETTGVVTIHRAGSSTITAIKAADEEYNEASASITLEIQKAVPVITEVPTPDSLHNGSALSSAVLTGGKAIGIDNNELSGSFAWSNPAQAVSAAGDYEAIFIPLDGENYTSASVPVRVEVIFPDNSDREKSKKDSKEKKLFLDEDVLAAMNITEKMMADAVMRGQSLYMVLARPMLESPDYEVNHSFEPEEIIVTLKLDPEAQREILRQSTGELTVTVTQVQSLSETAESLIGTRPVYNIFISYEKNGGKVFITTLNEGKAVLSIPYTPGKSERTGCLFAVYVDGSGNVERIADSVYDTESRNIVFTVKHLSIYGVGYNPPAKYFADTAQHWAKESIDYTVGRGLFAQVSENTFAPDAAVSRGILAMALGRLAGADVSAYKTGSFTDIKKDSSYLPYIEWAYKKGIVQGIGNSQFAPDRAITREEIAVIFANYAKAIGYKLPITREATAYADVDRIGSYAKEAVKAVQQAGIMTGYKNNRFNPEANATRAEIASILHRYIRLAIDSAAVPGLD